MNRRKIVVKGRENQSAVYSVKNESFKLECGREYLLSEDAIEALVKAGYKIAFPDKPPKVSKKITKTKKEAKPKEEPKKKSAPDTTGKDAG